MLQMVKSNANNDVNMTGPYSFLTKLQIFTQILKDTRCHNDAYYNWYGKIIHPIKFSFKFT